MNLKPIFAAASLALATVPAAFGQAPAPAAPVAAPSAGAAPAPAATPPKMDVKPPARRVTIVDADARGCLEFSSNQEIIKCAEKYLHRRAG